MPWNYWGMSDVTIAKWVALTTLCLALVVLLAILVLRRLADARQRRDRAAYQRWQAVFERALAGDALSSLPTTVDAGELAGLLEAWNALHERIAADQAQPLRALGQQLALSGRCAHLLRGSYHDRALAVIALGHLQDKQGFALVEPLLHDRSPIVSLCAARALSMIDPSQAMSRFIPLIVDRPEWTPGHVARILSENGEYVAVRELSNALLHASAETSVKLLRFLNDIDAQQSAQVVHRLLNEPVDDQVLSACLQVLHDRNDLPRVRQLLAAQRWHVRMHAASALGRLGTADDQTLLEPLLADPVWWVRYRAAEAIAALPGVGLSGLQATQTRVSDRFGRDIIAQVVAEKRMAEQPA